MRIARPFSYFVAAIGSLGLLAAATPPALVNYQGVLRDQNDKPLSGTYDMTFRFMDAATAGNEILIDQHAASSANAVSVSQGLFSVALGSGTVVDGSDSGTYTSLDQVFRDYAGVWLEVKIGAETLAPRTRFQAAAYALNATTAQLAVSSNYATDSAQLGGNPPGFFLDTSSNYQIKNGPLRIQNSDPSIAAISLACNGTSVGFQSNGCSQYGGLFESGSSSGTGVMGYNGYYGVRGIGTVGGLFNDPSFYNYAYVGDAPDGGGIAAIGQTRGGFFQTSTGNFGDFGYSDRGFYEYGVWSHGRTDGGYFENAISPSIWTFVADHLGATIRGNGYKSFEQNDPELPDRTITYAALEGDEVGTYTRGSGRLVKGEARVTLGSTFQFVSNPELGLTVYLTPIGAPARLYVADKSTREIVVKAAPGDPDVAFDYIVVGLRIGFEDANVVREKEQPSPVPSLAGLREQQARHPEFKETTPRARFESMDRGAGRAVSASYPMEHALFAKIQTADRGVTESPAAAGARIAPRDPGGNLVVGKSGGEIATPAQPNRAAPAIGSPAPASQLGVAIVRVAEFVQPGDVVAADPSGGELLRLGAKVADLLLTGIVVAPAPSMHLEAGEALVALAGSIVPCRVDATLGAIRAGDLLTSSPTPGHAMRTIDAAPGTIVGKALQDFDGGTGTIRVLVLAR